ncbi:hypothetical protein RIF29_24263 [Crotalaria pallida]|uniref:Uncharacterized protein n=1 Tax=Crotalaria pallida TaxID=3830 RepID=A0AAN9EK78_CROPI
MEVRNEDLEAGNLKLDGISNISLLRHGHKFSSRPCHVSKYNIALLMLQLSTCHQFLRVTVTQLESFKLLSLVCLVYFVLDHSYHNHTHHLLLIFFSLFLFIHRVPFHLI